MEQEKFNKQVELYNQSYTGSYQKFLEQANDKVYAVEFFRTKLAYSGNVKIPVQSFLFHQLTKGYCSLDKLGVADIVGLLTKQLPDIRKKTQLTYDMALNWVLYEKFEADFCAYELPVFYLNQIENQDISLETIIDIEKQVMEYNMDQLLDLLARYQAIQLLLGEIEDNEENLLGQVDSTILMNRNQQVLYFYYAFAAMGINKTNTDVSAMTDVFNLLFGLRSDKRRNEIYKKMLKPLEQNAKDETLNNLDIVAELFKRINCQFALHKIEEAKEEVAKLTKKPK